MNNGSFEIEIALWLSLISAILFGVDHMGRLYSKEQYRIIREFKMEWNKLGE